MGQAQQCKWLGLSLCSQFIVCPAGNEESPGCRTALVLVHAVWWTPFAASRSDAEKISEQKLPGGIARDLVRDLAPFQEWWVVQGTPFSEGPQDSLW